METKIIIIISAICGLIFLFNYVYIMYKDFSNEIYDIFKDSFNFEDDENLD